mmetsp:Transcript_10106/g.29066  ORF Transcript_10106/g.29066 Transcript_10106/m.29066 type:complete len:251 (+) Transcript_10106:2062-2814(+)
MRTASISSRILDDSSTISSIFFASFICFFSSFASASNFFQLPSTWTSPLFFMSSNFSFKSWTISGFRTRERTPDCALSVILSGLILVASASVQPSVSSGLSFVTVVFPSSCSKDDDDDDDDDNAFSRASCFTLFLLSLFSLSPSTACTASKTSLSCSSMLANAAARGTPSPDLLFDCLPSRITSSSSDETFVSTESSNVVFVVDFVAFLIPFSLSSSLNPSSESSLSVRLLILRLPIPSSCASASSPWLL